MQINASCRALAQKACINLSKLTMGNIRDGLVVGSSILPGTLDGHRVSKVVTVKVIGGNRVRITTEPVEKTDTAYNYQTDVFELQDSSTEEPPDKSVVDFMSHAIMAVLGWTKERVDFKD